MTMAQVGVWIGAALTLMCFSFLYKENPIYRVAEFLYVGLAAGYGVVATVDGYIRPTIKTDLMKNGEWLLLIPIVLGCMIYTRYIKSIAYLSRWTMAFFLGIGSGYVLTKDIQPYFITPIISTFKPLFVSGASTSTSINNIIFVVGVCASLVYFFFTTKRTGVLDYTAAFGRWVMMIALGAAFGNTVMARVLALPRPHAVPPRGLAEGPEVSTHAAKKDGPSGGRPSFLSTWRTLASRR